MSPEDMVQTIMLQDQILAQHHLTQAAHELQLKLRDELVDSLKKSRNMWRKQAGLFCFVICTMAAVLLTMWVILQQEQRRQANCPVVWKDPDVYPLPPTYIEGKAAQPAVDL